jgi:hypothetical protein
MDWNIEKEDYTNLLIAVFRKTIYSYSHNFYQAKGYSIS